MFSTLLFCEGHPLAIGLFGRDHLTIMQIVIISGGYLNVAQSEKNAVVLQKYCKYGPRPPPPLFFFCTVKYCMAKFAPATKKLCL